MIEVVVIVSLILMNVAQWIFWSNQNRLLVDRLMSRNYAEYVQTETNRFSEPPKPKDFSAEIAEEQEVLRELNGMLI